MEFSEQEIRHEVKTFIGQIIVTAQKCDDNIIIKLVTPFGTKKKAVPQTEGKELCKRILEWIQ